MTHTFLGSPSEIRAELLDRLPAARSVSIAVAFVTSEWSSLPGKFKRPCRVVCWLKSTNTNPYAVDVLRRRPSFRVRHLSAMHAKVYLINGIPASAIVGSANLSSAALCQSYEAGNVEAAVLLVGSKSTSSVSLWFDNLWKDSLEISDSDMAAAKRAYDRRPRPKKKSVIRLSQKKGSWSPTKSLLDLAKKARQISVRQLEEEICYQFIRDLDTKRMNKRGDLRLIIDCLADWAHHRGKFSPAMQEPLKRIRNAFGTAFDESLPVSERLRALKSSEKLEGLGLPAWTMILFWRSPSDYPPFNARTIRFLKDLKVSNHIPSVVTPSAYEEWCGLARELAIRLHLPTAGHVDRMVWFYTKSKPYG